MATYSHEHVFPHPWVVVARAFWDKYPSPELPHVRDAFVLARHVDEEGRLHTRRLICVQQDVPLAIRPFVANGRLNAYYALETSCVDADKRVLEMETRNVSFARLIDARSVSRYTPTEDGRGTRYHTESLVTCSLYLVRGRIEQALSQSSLKNSRKAVDVMETLCRRVLERDALAPAVGAMAGMGL